MSWLIGRNAAMADPAGARVKALAKLRTLAELDDPESLVVPILIDALLMVESYRGARHPFTFLPELPTASMRLLRELTISRKPRNGRRFTPARSFALAEPSAPASLSP